MISSREQYLRRFVDSFYRHDLGWDGTLSSWKLSSHIPVLCRNGILADASNGCGISEHELPETEGTATAPIHFHRRTVNQKLIRKAYAKRFRIHNGNIELLIFEASRLNKHGMNWTPIYMTVFFADNQPYFTETDVLSFQFWLSPEGDSLLSRKFLQSEKELY